MEELLAQAKKIPWQAWAIAGAAIGGILLWQQFTGGSSATRTPAPTPDTTPTPNTTTPTGENPCATYQTPNCSPPDFVIFEADQFGCPMPVCASSLTGGSGSGSGSGTGGSTSGVQCHVVQHGEYLTEIAANAGTPGGYKQLVTWNILPNVCGPGYPSLAVNPNLIQPGWDLRVA